MLKIALFGGFVLSAAVFFAKPALSATLYLSPASATYRVGDTFPVYVYVSSPSQAINTCQSVVAFPTEKLQVISATTKSSIFSLMVETPSYSNNAGSINFAGIILNPGYTGKSGRLLTINFKAKTVGTAKLSISSGQVLANDGSGSSVLTGTSGATINILEALPPPPPAPKKVPVPEVLTAPTPTVIYVTTTEQVTTTPEKEACACCNYQYLPNIFLKIGNVIFDSTAISLTLLIILLVISALLSLWGFWEMYVSKDRKKHKKK